MSQHHGAAKLRSRGTGDGRWLHGARPHPGQIFADPRDGDSNRVGRELELHLCRGERDGLRDLRFALTSARDHGRREILREMSEENIKVVRESLEAWLAGDLEKAAKLLDPEVEFHGTVGGLQEGEIAHGQSQIDHQFEEVDMEAWEERRLEAEEFIDAGDDVVVLLHEYRRGRGSGIELETKTAVVVAVSGGRVVRIQGYMDRDAALAAVGLSD